jgi:hypothetical protein
MMDNVELAQKILNLLGENTEGPDEAVMVMTLVITKILIVSQIDVCEFDARVSRIIREQLREQRRLLLFLTEQTDTDYLQ